MTEQPLGSQSWASARKNSDTASRDRFRHNLSRLMGERGITQAGLARTMDVSRVAVHAWIWGTCFPETSRLLKLAQSLDVHVGTLLEGEAASEASGSNEEALLLDAFRKLPSNARLRLLAGAYEMSAEAGKVKQPA